jgi:peptidyl-prolyl cis-trans isomerase SurA
MHLKYINSLLAITFTIITANAQVVDGIAAVVENNIVLQSDVEVQFQQMLANEMAYDDLHCDILDQLLLEKIFVVEAERDSIFVAPDEVDGELNRRIQYFVSMFGSEEKLEEYYGKKIFDLKEEFREDISQQLLSDRMQNSIFADIHVSPKEVFDFFNSIPKDSLPFFNAEVEIGQIVIFAEPSFVQKNQAREKAERIKKEIEEGGDFEFLALLHSDDPGSATKGGALGYVKRGELVTEFEASAFRLKPNEVSDVVETVFGFHVIQLIDKKGDRVNVRHILISPGIENENVEKAQQTIQKVKEKLQNKELTFQQAVAQYSKDDMTKNNGGLLTNPQTGNNFFEMNQLDGDVALALENMNVGDFSDILPYKTPEGKYGFRIVYLRSETPAHQANLDTDYSKIKAVAKQAKQAEVLNKWIEQKSKTIYIKVNEQYTHCENIQKWLHQ